MAYVSQVLLTSEWPETYWSTAKRCEALRKTSKWKEMKGFERLRTPWTPASEARRCEISSSNWSQDTMPGARVTFLRAFERCMQVPTCTDWGSDSLSFWSKSPSISSSFLSFSYLFFIFSLYFFMTSSLKALGGRPSRAPTALSAPPWLSARRMRIATPRRFEDCALGVFEAGENQKWFHIMSMRLDP